ncbi:hypothetical protein [Polaromonas sp.]|uniref:hypothetical protein n=1 Tax=Polaromonas sp. TaxID=1869339 RepID=UPI0035661166
MSSKKQFFPNITDLALSPEGYILLAQFEQQQDRKIVVRNVTDDQLLLTGDLDLLRWNEAHILLDAVKSALVQTNTFPGELLVCTCYLVLCGSNCRVGLRLWVRGEDRHDLNLGEVAAITTCVTAALTSGSHFDEIENDLFSELPKTRHEGLKKAVQGTLQSFGARRFTGAVHVTSADQRLKVEGRLGAKPDRSNHHPKEEILIGKFDGFDLHNRWLIFLSESKRHLLSFSPDQVDLISVAHSALKAEVQSVRTYKTLDRKGNPIYAFAPDAPFKSA